MAASTAPGGRAPRDQTVLVLRKKKIETSAFLCVSSCSICGLILAGSFLAFNLYHRRLRYIKLSSPKLNNVAVIGCMLVYAGIIVLGYDDTRIDELYFPFFCTARAFLFAAGFSLSFGAMFTKTYRVHQIFTRANKGLIKSKLLRDKQLLSIVGALLVVDTVVLLLWGFVDPMHKQITNLTMEIAEDDDLLYISQLTKCTSHYLDKWTGILYVYKGLMLVFGVYMAWETRNVKIPALNDARYIGMNVYNVVITSVLVVTISNILSHQPTLAYIMESSFMLVSTTTTLCLLFVPKIYALLTYKGEPIIAASGITVEANCRRFAVDERKEHLYRAEVQNRAYKRELLELDEEITRLARLVNLPLKPYPKLTGDMLSLLPESLVDHTPTRKMQFGQEMDVSCSISDAGDVCMGLSGIRTIDGVHPRPKPFCRRSNRMSIRVATNYAYTKLCKLRPRFSVGSLNFKHEYDDLKTSQTSSDGHFLQSATIGRSKSSHLLSRQEQQLEVKPVKEINTVCKQVCDNSETRTYHTYLSEEAMSKYADEYSLVTLQVPQAHIDYLKVPSNTDVTYSAIVGKCRKQSCTLAVPTVHEGCPTPENDVKSAMKTYHLHGAESITEPGHIRTTDMLPSDFRRIRKELQHQNEIGHRVSVV